MSDDSNTSPSEEARPDVHRAVSSKQSRLSPIWIVPIVALFIGLWLAYDSYNRIGPRITLTMPNAEGIEAGKTMIKTLNVDIGQVEQVKLSDDLTHTLIIARINPDAEAMLVEDSRFWVVKPRIGREGISGLGTVLSGAYIQLAPGQSTEPQREFAVLEQPPSSLLYADGVRIMLESDLGKALRPGDPVTYKNHVVGRVESTEFVTETRKMRHQLIIETPYDSLVTESTRFWSATGIDLRLDADGFRVNVAALESLLTGGVTFGLLEGLPPGKPVDDSSVFTLYANEESARQGAYNKYLEYVLMVDGTVRGLRKGAPVEFRGLRIGTVHAVPWRFMSRQSYAIPVLIRIEPQRLLAGDPVDLKEWSERIERMTQAGMRASLKSGNLLTGAVFVDLSFQRDITEPYEPTTFEGRPVLPTVSTGLAQIEQQVADLLEKLNNLQVEPLLSSVDNTMSSTQDMLNNVGELTQSLQSLTRSLESMLEDPQTREIPQNINDTLKELQQIMQGLTPDSGVYQEMTRTLQRLEKLMRDLQPVARTLGEQPNALIFERRIDADPQPRAPRNQE